jgi:hypothetical protein
MRWFWLTAFFLAIFWLNTVPVFTPPGDGWIWLVLAAVVAAGLGLRKTTVEEFDPRWLVTVVPLAVAAIYLPFPFHLPAIMLIVAAVLLSTARFSRSLAWVGLPVGLAGLVLSVQAAVFPFIYIFSSRVHDLPWLTPLFYLLAKPFNPLVSLSENEIIIPYVYNIFTFPTRLESLGFIPLALVAAAGITFLVIARRSGRAILGFLALLVGYSALRYLFMIFLVVKFKTSHIFWLLEPTAVSYIPLVLFLAGLGGLNRSPDRPKLAVAWPGTARVLTVLVLVTAGVIGFTGLFAYHDAGTRKGGRMMIEEIHSDWEWTTQAYDTYWYGRKSGYNYYCLAQYLDHFYHVDSRADSLLPEVLSEYDMVMLKTPTESYSQEEMDALVEFVRQGGGLWLHGDHTNVFGISTYLNPLAERFGCRFRYDSTYQLSTMALSLYERPPLFAHPVENYMPPYLFATSCSLESPFFSENQILGYALKASDLDYSQTSFFPKKDNLDYNYGVFVQQGGVKYGKGRVALYTDSTCFSNFFMFIPGKPELALATVEWLNRANRLAWMNKLLFVLGLAALVAAGLVMRRGSRPQGTTLCLSAGFLGIALAALIYDGHVRRSYAPPEPHTDYVHIAFESEHSRVTLPTRGLTRNPEISLHTFFVWTQRLGFFPSFEPTLEEALQKGDLVVIADPWRPFEQEEIDALVLYLSRGGKALILIDSRNFTQAPRELLGSLGIRLAAPPPPEEPSEAEEGQADSEEAEPEDRALYIQSLDGDRIVAPQRPVGLTGGTPLLRLSDDRTVFLRTPVGQGYVYVWGDFFLFTDESMGHTGEMLDTRKRHISELEYWMLREILGIEQDEPFWKKITAVP